MDEVLPYAMNARMRSVTVRAAARAHIGLIDLAFATGRAYGGAGFAISGPETIVSAVRARKSHMHAEVDLDSRDVADLIDCLERLSARYPTIRSEVVVKQAPPSHSGFGSKTSLLLAAITASSTASTVGLLPEEIQLLSRRGGASGIGIHSFFRGGFIIDAGHKVDDIASLMPSSARLPCSVPPVAFHKQMPSHWVVTLALPRGIMTNGRNEQEFFERETPLPREEVLETLALIYHGVLPSIVTEDLNSFAHAITALQRIGFKAREIATQPPGGADLIRNLDSPCRVVGMSSMGPLIYIIDKRGHSDTVRRVSSTAEVVGEFSIPTAGHSVIIDD